MVIYKAIIFQTDFGFDTKQTDNIYLLDVANNSFLQKKKKKGFPASYLYQYLYGFTGVNVTRFSRHLNCCSLCLCFNFQPTSFQIGNEGSSIFRLVSWVFICRLVFPDKSEVLRERRAFFCLMCA